MESRLAAQRRRRGPAPRRPASCCGRRARSRQRPAPSGSAPSGRDRPGRRSRTRSHAAPLELRQRGAAERPSAPLDGPVAARRSACRKRTSASTSVAGAGQRDAVQPQAVVARPALRPRRPAGRRSRTASASRSWPRSACRGRGRSPRRAACRAAPRSRRHAHGPSPSAGVRGRAARRRPRRSKAARARLAAAEPLGRVGVQPHPAAVRVVPLDHPPPGRDRHAPRRRARPGHRDDLDLPAVAAVEHRAAEVEAERDEAAREAVEVLGRRQLEVVGAGAAAARTWSLPVKLGTSVLVCAQRKLWVVADQRSGSPNSSTRRARVSASYVRRAGSMLIWAVRATVNTSRPEPSLISSSNRSVGAAASSTNETPSTLNSGTIGPSFGAAGSSAGCRRVCSPLSSPTLTGRPPRCAFTPRPPRRASRRTRP